ncbi:MAG: hypothetical protein ACOYMN_02840, partial [Roseimicrobium sp.]
FAEVSFTGALAPYSAWQAASFPGGASDADAGLLLDPDGDGNNNLVEYATGGNPLNSSQSGIARDVATVGSESYLRLTVAKNPAASDVTFEVQATGALNDANSWSSDGLVIEENTASTLRVRDVVPLSTSSARFMRVRISR